MWNGGLDGRTGDWLVGSVGWPISTYLHQRCRSIPYLVGVGPLRAVVVRDEEEGLLDVVLPVDGEPLLFAVAHGAVDVSAVMGGVDDWRHIYNPEVRV